MNDISMTQKDWLALCDTHAHLVRALSAAQACEPFCSTSMVALDAVRMGLTQQLRVIDQIKARARVTP